jgi:hypothetical protein
MLLRRSPATAADPFLPRGAIYAARLSNTRQGREEFALAEDTVGLDLRQFLLEWRVLELEESLSRAKQDLGRREAQHAAQYVSLIGAIREMSERLFPGPITIEHACDPEDSSHQYLVFDVVADGEYVDYRERIFQWHDEVERLVGGPTSEFRLIVHPKP